MSKRVSDLHYGEIQRGFCPVCLNYCYCIKLREGGRQFGFKWVGERDVAIFGDVVWDSAHAIYWHMGIEADYDMTDDEVLSHFIDDMNMMLRRGEDAKAQALAAKQKPASRPLSFDEAAAWFPGVAA